MQNKAEKNTNAALAYLVGWLSGLFFLLTEKEDDFIRFNAAQSVVLFGGVTVISFIPFLGQIVGLILWPVTLILWVVLMVKAYKGERFELPLVTSWAKKLEKAVKPQ